MPRPGMAARIAAFMLLSLAHPLLPSLHTTAAPSQHVPAGQIELWFGGDIHFGNTAQNPLLLLRSVTNGRLGIVNLEGPVHEPADTVYGNKVLKLYNAPQTVDYLTALNVKVATVANNHQDDAGIAGKNATDENLRRAGVLPVGGSRSSVVYRAGEYRLVFAAYDLSGPALRGLAGELARLRDTGDILIVLFHAGGNPGYLPDAKLKKAVEMAIRAKASIIVSHGSHSIGPVERRDGAIIAWGLGNLTFNCRCTDEREAVILTVIIDPARKERPVASSCVVPIDAGMQGMLSKPAMDPAAIFDLLDALGSSRLSRQQDRACF